MPTLTSLSIENFRSIKGSINVRLDAPIVLIHGVNGAGKTSLLTAIEIALTGQSNSLKKIDPEYTSYLPHQEFQQAKISLSATGLNPLSKSAELIITKQKIEGRPLLEDHHSRFFSERCYLAQSTLGKLLEIYQHKDTRNSDSPLTSFVKDLLGLDQLDALIDGLHAAARIDRLRLVVPNLRSFEESRAKNQEDYEEIKSTVNTLHEKFKTLVASFREEIEKHNLIFENFTNFSQARSFLEKDLEESRLILLSESRINIEASKKQWEKYFATHSDLNEQTLEIDAELARWQLEAWQTQYGSKIEGILNSLRKYFSDIPSIAGTQPDFAVKTALQYSQSELERCTSQLAQYEKDKETLETLKQEITRRESRASILDIQVLDLASYSEGVSKILGELLQHINGEVCPVCDRDFSDYSDVSLAEHVSDKITFIKENAAKLKTISQEKSEIMALLSALKREREVVFSRQIEVYELNELKSRQADLAEAIDQLEALEAVVESGMAIISNSLRLEQKLSAIKGREQQYSIIKSEILSVSQKLEYPDFDENSSLTVMADSLKSFIVKEEERLRKNKLDRHNLLFKLTEIESVDTELKNLRKKATEFEKRKRNFDQTYRNFDDLREQAKDLAKLSQETRTQIVRQVFNGSLNKLWSDFFIRLAPEEPFVPAFALPEESSGPVEAVLETIYRSGEKGGNPRTMLSAGNLNTAALTLFLALHFSVDSKLPWLIIDDPVQSMDELHISQFAAFLRTISKQEKRQTILAVHDRSLFDYLTLELSPAYEGDRLITIELGKATDGQSIVNYNQHIWKKDRAIAV